MNAKKNVTLCPYYKLSRPWHSLEIRSAVLAFRGPSLQPSTDHLYGSLATQHLFLWRKRSRSKKLNWRFLVNAVSVKNCKVVFGYEFVIVCVMSSLGALSSSFWGIFSTIQHVFTDAFKGTLL